MDKASELEKRGHVESAEGLRKLVSGNVASSDGRHHGMAERGRGLLADETASVTEKQSYDGKAAETYVRHGSDVSWFDTSSDRQGRTVRKGDDTDRGDHVRLGNTVTLDDGTHIPAQSAVQMARDANPLLVSQISKPGLSADERATERLNVAAVVSDGLSSLISRIGTSQDYSGADGSASARIPGIGIGGAVSTGYRTTDQYDSKLMAQHFNDVLKSADQEAASKGLSRADNDRLTADRLQAAVQSETKYFEEHGKWSYGATGAVTRVGKGVKDALQKKGPDFKKSGVDGIKG